jgi:hypothetical protein
LRLALKKEAAYAGFYALRSMTSSTFCTSWAVCGPSITSSKTTKKNIHIPSHHKKTRNKKVETEVKISTSFQRCYADDYSSLTMVVQS